MKLLYLIVNDHLYYVIALLGLSVVSFGLGLSLGFLWLLLP